MKKMHPSKRQFIGQVLESLAFFAASVYMTRCPRPARQPSYLVNIGVRMLVVVTV